MNINEIIEFRKRTTNNCVSTTHTMTPDQYRELAPLLINHFKEFKVQKKERHLMAYKFRSNINLPSQMVEVTISN